MDTVTLKLNRVQYPISSLGPGKRFGIWVQGCTIHCEDCISKSLWDFNSGQAVPVKALAEIIFQMGAVIEGVSITGGEPFDQYGPLMAFCSYLKALGGSPIQIFTGYVLDEIEKAHPDQTYAKCIDALIDGPYSSSKNEGDSWRGSTNQNFYTFEKGVANKKVYPYSKGDWALTSTLNGEHFFAGIPGPETLSNLEEYMKRSGMCMRFENGD